MIRANLYPQTPRTQNAHLLQLFNNYATILSLPPPLLTFPPTHHSLANHLPPTPPFPPKKALLNYPGRLRNTNANPTQPTYPTPSPPCHIPRIGQSAADEGCLSESECDEAEETEFGGAEGGES